MLRRAFDAGEAEGYAPVRIRAAESAAIAPGGVKLIIGPPGHGPQIASQRRVGISFPMPDNALERLAVRIRRLGCRRNANRN